MEYTHNRHMHELVPKISEVQRKLECKTFDEDRVLAQPCFVGTFCEIGAKFIIVASTSQLAWRRWDIAGKASLGS